MARNVKSAVAREHLRNAEEAIRNADHAVVRGHCEWAVARVVDAATSFGRARQARRGKVIPKDENDTYRALEAVERRVANACDCGRKA